MINKTTQSLNFLQQIGRRLAALERAMRELKASNQPIGADVLKVIAIPEDGYALAGPLTVAPGSAITVTAEFTPANSTLTQWDILASVYVDQDDPAYEYPSGASISAAQKQLDREDWTDYGESSDTSNSRVYKIRIKNRDTASHDYFVHARSYLPALAGSTSS